MSLGRLMSGHLAHITDLRYIYEHGMREVNAKLIIYLYIKLSWSTPHGAFIPVLIIIIMLIAQMIVIRNKTEGRVFEEVVANRR